MTNHDRNHDNTRTRAHSRQRNGTFAGQDVLVLLVQRRQLLAQLQSTNQPFRKRTSMDSWPDEAARWREVRQARIEKPPAQTTQAQSQLCGDLENNSESLSDIKKTSNQEAHGRTKRERTHLRHDFGELGGRLRLVHVRRVLDAASQRAKRNQT
jgi:hypothetical protein